MKIVETFKLAETFQHIPYEPFTPKNDQFQISLAASPENATTQYGELGFSCWSLLRWKIITPPILITYTFFRLGEYTFWAWEWKGQPKWVWLSQVVLKIWRELDWAVILFDNSFFWRDKWTFRRKQCEDPVGNCHDEMEYLQQTTAFDSTVSSSHRFIIRVECQSVPPHVNHLHSLGMPQVALQPNMFLLTAWIIRQLVLGSPAFVSALLLFVWTSTLLHLQDKFRRYWRIIILFPLIHYERRHLWILHQLPLSYSKFFNFRLNVTILCHFGELFSVAILSTIRFAGNSRF